MEAISSARQPSWTQGNSLLNCVLKYPLCDQSPVEAIPGAREPSSTQGNSLLNCVLRCPLLQPISFGGPFWRSSTIVNTRQFFTQLCTKMSTLRHISCGSHFWRSSTMVKARQFFTKLCTKISIFETNLAWRPFLALANYGQHKAIDAKSSHFIDKHC